MATGSNKTFCVLPWLHFHVGPQGLSSVCCDANEYDLNFGFVDETDLLKGFNSQQMRDIRQAMLEGRQVKGCDRCYTNEENGIRSARQFYNEQIFPVEAAKYLAAGSADSDGVISIDFRADNSCNLKCRTCNPLYSSALATEERLAGVLPARPEKVAMSIMTLLDHIDFSKIRRMYFAGGEPLLARDHYKFLQTLIDRGHTDIELVYTTNVSRFSYSNYEILRIWSSFKHVVLGLSLDSWGERAEYMRTGQDWEQTLKDIRIARTMLSNAYIFCSTTMSVLNTITLPEFIEQLVEKQLFTRSQFHLHMVYQPFEFRVDSMGEAFRAVADQSLEKYIEKLTGMGETELAGKVEGLRHFLNAKDQPDRRQEFFRSSEAKDKLRNTSWVKTFPELHVLT